MPLMFSALLAFPLTGAPASAQDTTLRSDAAAPRLRVDIVFVGPVLPPKVEASAMEEITGVWALYGVDVFKASAGDAVPDGDVRLTVVMADHPDRPMSRRALGSILFVDEEPQPEISMYRHAIDILVSNVRLVGSTDQQWPTAFREMIVGRVLGRGVAHEIGHYLLRSRQHAEVGLMRAPHLTNDLVGGDRRQFALSAEERMRLASFISSRLRPSSATPSAGAHSR
ncbi:MAG: hypothetical protein ACRD2I_28035 [Vicinamibacterales bacterium]